MKALLAAALLALKAAAYAAPAARLLHTDPEDGVTILRDAGLAEALKESDRLCSLYDRRQESADRLAAKAKNAREKREAAAALSSARRLMAECLHADKLAQARLARVLGRSAAERVQKAAAFEDMVYLVAEPTPAVKVYAELFEPGGHGPVAAK